MGLRKAHVETAWIPLTLDVILVILWWVTVTKMAFRNIFRSFKADVPVSNSDRDGFFTPFTYYANIRLQMFSY